MMAPAGVELEMLVSEPDALTTRPPPCATKHDAAQCPCPTMYLRLQWLHLF